MSKSARTDPIPLPKSWPQYIKAGVIHAISLAHSNGELGRRSAGAPIKTAKE
jgi:hypothetical protein